MEYNNEQEMDGPKAEIANQCVHATAKIMEVSLRAMSEAGEKVSLLAGCSIPSLHGLAVVFCNQSGWDETACQPTADEITFGACYVIASVENHERGVIMGFNPETLDKALSIFHNTMGREYTNISPLLRTLIDQQKRRADKATPPNLRKFLPN